MYYNTWNIISQLGIIMYMIRNIESKLNNKIGIKIKFERIKKGLSQEKLAELANLDAGTISKIERNATSPTIVTIEKIANALGLTFLELVDVSKVDL